MSIGDITPATVRAEVERIAAERPDFVYAPPMELGTCVYARPDGSPDCIVGHAFAALGVLAEVAAFEDGDGNEESIWVLGASMFGWDESRYSDLDFDWLTVVQYNQDNGTSWGEAVAIAKEEEEAEAE